MRGKTKKLANDDEQTVIAHAIENGNQVFSCTLNRGSGELPLKFYVSAPSKGSAKGFMSEHYYHNFQPYSLKLADLGNAPAAVETEAKETQDHFGPDRQMVPIKVRNALADIYERLGRLGEPSSTSGLPTSMRVNAMDVARSADEHAQALHAKYDELKQIVSNLAGSCHELKQRMDYHTQLYGGIPKEIETLTLKNQHCHERCAAMERKTAELAAETLKAISALNDLNQSTGSTGKAVWRPQPKDVVRHKETGAAILVQSAGHDDVSGHAITGEIIKGLEFNQKGDIDDFERTHIRVIVPVDACEAFKTLAQ